MHDESRQLQFEGFLMDDRVETEIISEALSASPMPKETEIAKDAKSYLLTEKVLLKENLNKAYLKVKRNKGSHGIDGMSINELGDYLKANKDSLIRQIETGSYKPQPVRRVEIPKPDGGVRMLGIPTVVDRVVQQAIAQVLVPIYEAKFSENSFGFRPGKCAHDAVAKARACIDKGYRFIVDIDLEKYFDTVCHDKLMRIVSQDIKDSKLLSLIRKFLKSGVLVDGMFCETAKGCPQGGNLSPLLANIMLNELDSELTKRGLNFVRYADDINIYAKSAKAAERILASITKFIENKLRLKINRQKSKVVTPVNLKFLGFSFYRRKDGKTAIRVHPKTYLIFKLKLKQITARSYGISMQRRYLLLKTAITGWINYFGIADMKSLARDLDSWLRRRIRMCYWKQWKTIRARHKNLILLGIESRKALYYAFTRLKYWAIAGSWILSTTLTNEVLIKQGYTSISSMYLLNR